MKIAIVKDDDNNVTIKGLKQAQHLVTASGTNYYGKIIEKTAYIYNILNLIDTDILLDIGSGLGDISKNFSKIVKQIHCCDIDDALLNMAEINCQHRANMFFHKVTVATTPLNFLEDESITKAFATSVFINCEEDVLIYYLKEVHRVLKKDGLFTAEYCIKSAEPIFVPLDKNKIEDIIRKLNFNVIQYREVHGRIYSINFLISK